MSSNPQRLQYLFQRYLDNTATVSELQEFWKLFSELDDRDDGIRKDLWQLWNKMDTGMPVAHTGWENTLGQIHLQARKWEQSQTPVIRRLPVQRIAAAAVIIILLAAGGYVFFSKRAPVTVARTVRPALHNDVPAGGNKATLTLSNGNTIILGTAPVGTLAVQGNINILKLDSSQLFYNGPKSANDKTAILQYNTLTTPRGGQYHITLADGTIVWLNSASSIHYPIAFSVHERAVAITGEAYFEVAHKPNQPFRVSVNGITVEVLGTHFDINAYDDEPAIKTSLLEGSIRLTAGGKVQLLSPGQQLQVQGTRTKLVKNIDTEQIIAWKNGVFAFRNTSIYEVMRQISRWYDVDVNFKEPMDVYLNGTIPKNVNVSQVIRMIELTGEAKFAVEGKKITVTR
jgi:ferric-dicitrate binding protein FerR (iron transport regulator)